MRSLVALALLLPLAGCAKKVAKSTGRADDTASAPQPPPPAAKSAPGKEDEEKPNWLNDPRYKKIDPADRELPADAPPGGKPGWGVTPPPGGRDRQDPGLSTVVPPAGGAAPTPPQPAPTPPAPTTGTPAKPAGRAVTRADLNDIWVFVENASLASGKMPGPDAVVAALVAAKSPAAELVRGGAIYLTGARVRESIWAFERDAPTRGGWVAGHNGPEHLTAAEFARRAAPGR